MDRQSEAFVEHMVEVFDKLVAAADEIEARGDMRSEGADHAVCRHIVDTELHRSHVDDLAFVDLIVESVVGHLVDEFARDLHFTGQTALDLDALGHQRAASDRDVDTVDVASRFAHLQTLDDVADGGGSLHDVADAAVTHSVTEFLLFDCLYAQCALRVHGAYRTLDFRAPDFKSHYIFFFHGDMLVFQLVFSVFDSVFLGAELS